jgi:ATP-dependent exoDNAse (exonuclease V) beta subunit
VHSAQGVTADTTHAVISETATRPLFYVAMSRGRDTNIAYLYQRTTEHEYPQEPAAAPHVIQRGSSQHAGKLLRVIVANNHEQPVTAHDYAAHPPGAAPPDRVRRIVDRRTTAVHRRRATYESWFTEAQNHAQSMGRAREHAASRSRHRSSDTGIEL